MKKENFGFKRGWLQVSIGDAAECRRKLMEALGIETRAAFLNRMKGNIEPRASEMKAIEDIFFEYGITEIWGE